MTPPSSSRDRYRIDPQEWLDAGLIEPDEGDDDGPAIGDARQPDLDFDLTFGGDVPLGLRGRPEPVGIPATGWHGRSTEYDSWTCQCRATAKTGIPPRHVMKYDSTSPAAPDWPYRIMISSVELKAPEQKHGPIKRDADGRPIVDDEPEKVVSYVECPTWRRDRKISKSVERDWRKLAPSLPPPSEPEPEPVTHPAGPTEPATELTELIEWAELGRSAKQLAPFVTGPVLRVAGRLVDDGPVVVQHRLVGAGWVAVFTDGGYDHGRIEGQPGNFNDLRSYAKGSQPRDSRCDQSSPSSRPDRRTAAGRDTSSVGTRAVDARADGLRLSGAHPSPGVL